MAGPVTFGDATYKRDTYLHEAAGRDLDGALAVLDSPACRGGDDLPAVLCGGPRT